MKIMAIWETPDANATKIIRSKKELQKAKFRGKKPNRMLVHPEDMKVVTPTQLKKYIAHTGIIILLGTAKPIYDGRVRNGSKPSLLITDDIKSN